jgi:DNA-binding IclR family transcriptional regulator
VPLEAAILDWLAARERPVTVWDIRAGVGSDVGETFRALAALVVRGSVERDGATFRLAAAHAAPEPAAC